MKKVLPMKQGSTLFLKVVIVLIGVVALFGLLKFPQTEGRATNLDLISIYMDPFILYMYLISVPFFVALFQALKLLGFIEKNNIFSQAAVKIVNNIKLCVMVFIVLFAAAIMYIVTMARTMPEEDPAGFIMIGIVVLFASAIIATAAGVAQKLLQHAVDMKSENDLTV